MIDLRPLAAYIAGIIDGEGYVGIRRLDPRSSKGEKSPRFMSSLQIRMCDQGAIKVLEAISGKKALLAGRTKERWSPIWEWAIFCKQAATLLRAVLPYLQVKQREAKLLLEMETAFSAWNSRARAGEYGFPQVPKEITAHREDIYKRFRAVVAARRVG